MFIKNSNLLTALPNTRMPFRRKNEKIFSNIFLPLTDKPRETPKVAIKIKNFVLHW
jgi:hypothetical protein